MSGVQDIYVALFGRPADPEGLAFWNQVTNNGADLTKMLAALPFTGEYTTRFAGQTTEQIITTVYQSLFGRAPDAVGLKFFADRLASGEQTIATIAVNIAQGAQGPDKLTFAAKVTAADLFTQSLDTPAEIAAYKGDTAAKAAQTFLGAIDKDNQATQTTIDRAVGTVTGTMPPTTDPGPSDPAPTGPLVLGKSFEQGDLAPLVVTNTTDPRFSTQWYLKNTGQREPVGSTNTLRLDMNVEGAWLEGYTGKGIKVAINDDGIDLAHRALQANLLQDLTYNPGTGVKGPTAYDSGITEPAHGHGTVVGSIVGMAAGDEIDLVGVAPGVKLVSGVALEDNMKWVPKLHNYMTDIAKVDVSVNSYGRDPAFSENFYTGVNPNDTTTSQEKKAYDNAYVEAFEKAASEGRNKLGTVIEISSGNERGKNADAAMTGTTNNKHVIAVGAVNEKGEAASYSTGGASILVSALGGEDNDLPEVDGEPPPNNGGHVDNRGYALAAADLSGDKGDNKLAGNAGDFSFNNYGTSYSGPIVGATAALMLQANPLLGFRDVANILAMTARHVATAPDAVLLKGDMVNFGGLTFARSIGFGVVDITAAVRLAASWVEDARTTHNWISVEGSNFSPGHVVGGATVAGTVIPDNNATGVSVIATLNEDIVIERMEFDLDIDSTRVRQLKAEVTSPEGTTIVLFDKPMAVAGADNAQTTADNIWPGIFQIGATAFLGERSKGDWTLKLTDTVTGEVATYHSLTVRAWGSPVTSDSQYILTDAFSGTKTFSDDAGMDLINGAAVSTAMTINLNEGQISVIHNAVGGAKGTFTIAQGDVIENAFGGAGDDVIIGNDFANILRGNGGKDTLTGNGGADIFMFATVNDSYVEAPDTITDFEVNQDYIDLRLLDANVHLADNQDFRFAGERADVVANSVVFTREDGGLAGWRTIILADINGDTTADVKIILLGNIALTADHFLGLAA